MPQVSRNDCDSEQVLIRPERQLASGIIPLAGSLPINVVVFHMLRSWDYQSVVTVTVGLDPLNLPLSKVSFFRDRNRAVRQKW
ncbi:MAG: hypothetical protein FJW26_15585 [Acidimicrobiia bacterium]|nr:hypothetical protein [Acidimicrobiia bacterium]